MSRFFLLCPWIVVLTLLTACGKSTPTNYFVLSGGDDLTTQDNLPRSTLRIARVGVPSYLDRDAIVVRKDGKSLLAINSMNLWAEPLSEGIRKVLLTELTNPLLEKNITVQPPQSEEAGDLTLIVDIFRLDGELSREAVLNAAWSLVESRNNRVITNGLFSHKKTLSTPSYQELVLAESALTRAMAAHILERILPVVGKR